MSFTIHTGSNGVSGARQKFTGRPSLTKSMRVSIERAKQADRHHYLANLAKIQDFESEYCVGGMRKMPQANAAPFIREEIEVRPGLNSAQFLTNEDGTKVDSLMQDHSIAESVRKQFMNRIRSQQGDPNELEEADLRHFEMIFKNTLMKRATQRKREQLQELGRVSLHNESADRMVDMIEASKIRPQFNKRAKNKTGRYPAHDLLLDPERAGSDMAQFEKPARRSAFNEGANTAANSIHYVSGQGGSHAGLDTNRGMQIESTLTNQSVRVGTLGQQSNELDTLTVNTAGGTQLQLQTTKFDYDHRMELPRNLRQSMAMEQGLPFFPASAHPKSSSKQRHSINLTQSALEHKAEKFHPKGSPRHIEVANDDDPDIFDVRHAQNLQYSQNHFETQDLRARFGEDLRGARKPSEEVLSGIATRSKHAEPDVTNGVETKKKYGLDDVRRVIDKQISKLEYGQEMHEQHFRSSSDRKPFAFGAPNQIGFLAATHVSRQNAFKKAINDMKAQAPREREGAGSVIAVSKNKIDTSVFDNRGPGLLDRMIAASLRGNASVMQKVPYRSPIEKKKQLVRTHKQTQAAKQYGPEYQRRKLQQQAEQIPNIMFHNEYSGQSGNPTNTLLPKIESRMTTPLKIPPSRVAAQQYSHIRAAESSKRQLQESSPLRIHEFCDSPVERHEQHDSQLSAAENEISRFTHEERQQRAKYCISDGAKQVIKLIDEIISEKNEKKRLIQQRRESLENLATSAMHDSPIRVQENVLMDDQEDLKDDQAMAQSDKSSLMTPHPIYLGGKRLSTDFQLSPKKPSRLKDYLEQSGQKMNQRNKNLPIIKEIMKEEKEKVQALAEIANGQQSSVAKIPDIGKECGVRGKAKNYIRYLRGMEPLTPVRDLQQNPRMVASQEELLSDPGHGQKKKGKKKREPPKVLPVSNCNHKVNDEEAEARGILFMIWYTEFQNRLGQSLQRIKISKDSLYKAFVNLVQANEDLNPLMSDMRKYVMDSKLFERHEELMDALMFEYENKHLILKRYEGAPLDEEEQQYLGPIDGELKDARDVKLYDCESVKATTQGYFSRFESRKTVEISQAMYKRFLADARDCGVHEHEVIPLKEPSMGLTKAQLLTSVRESLEHVLTTLGELHDIVEERNNDTGKQAPGMMHHRRVTAGKEEFPLKPDKDVDFVKKALERNIKRQLDRTHAISQELLRSTSSANDSQGGIPKEPGSPMKAQLTLRDKYTSVGGPLPARDPLDETKAVNVKLFDNHERQQAFFSHAKQLIIQPSHKCQIDEPTMRFKDSCRSSGISARPTFINLIKDNKLMIQKEYMSVDRCQAIVDLLDEAIQCNKAEYFIDTLLVDECGMDDTRIAMLLKALQKQERIKSLTIMNCSIGSKSMELILHMLDKRAPLQLEELRLVNLKGVLPHSSKVQEYSLVSIMEALMSHHLRVLQLSSLDLCDSQLIQCIGETIANPHLREFDLSNSKMSLGQFGVLTEALRVNDVLQTLSLKGIRLLSILEGDQRLINEWDRQKGTVRDDLLSKEETIKECIDGINEFIANSRSLQHLDISLMALKGKILDLADSIYSSTTLLSIHLGGNMLDKKTLEELFLKFKIDKETFGSYLNKKIGVMDSVDQMQHGNDIRDIVLDTFTDEEGISDISKSFHMLSPANSRCVSPPPMDENGLLTATGLIGKEIQRDQLQSNITTLIKRQDGVNRNVDGHQAKLVLSRKLQHPELLFNEKMQIGNSEAVRHFDLQNINSSWAMNFSEEECYVCGKHPYVQVFYRRDRAEQDFIKVTSSEEIRQLRNQYRIAASQNSKSDPYRQYPLIFGSLFQGEGKTGADVDHKTPHSSRMLLAKYQAALVFAYENAQIHASSDDYPKTLKRLTKGVMKLIQHHASGGKFALSQGGAPPLKASDEAELKKLLSAWRNYLFAPPGEDDDRYFGPRADVIVNQPLFDAQCPEEDDIYVFSNYISPVKTKSPASPATHWCCVYDPVTDLFWKKTGIILFPRPDDFIHHNMPIVSPRNLPVEIKDYQKFSQNLRAVLSLIFGQMLADHSHKMTQFTYKQDFKRLGSMGPKGDFLKHALSQDVARHYDELKDIFRENYCVISKSYKLIQIQVGHLNNVSSTVLAEQILPMISSFASKSVIEQTIGIVNELFQNQKITDKEIAIFSRKKFAVCLLRIAQLQYEHGLKNGKAKGQTLPSSLEKLISKGPKAFLNKDDNLRDIELMRKVLVYKNKGLINVVLQHRGSLEKIFKHRHVYDFKANRFTFAKGLKSLCQYMAEPHAQHGDFSASFQFEKLAHIARLSQRCCMNEDIEVPMGSDAVLNFEEFILTLIYAALDSKYKKVAEPAPEQEAENENEEKANPPAIEEPYNFQNHVYALILKSKNDEGDQYTEMAMQVQRLICLLANRCEVEESEPLTEENILGLETTGKTDYFGKQRPLSNIIAKLLINKTSKTEDKNKKDKAKEVKNENESSSDLDDGYD